MMTQNEYEMEIAQKLGGSIDELRRNALATMRCDCGDETCRGWRLTDAAMMSGLVKIDIYRKPQEAAVEP